MRDRRPLTRLSIVAALVFVSAHTQAWGSEPDPLDELDEEIAAAAEALRTRAERQAASSELTRRAVDAFASGEYARAESILLEQREIDPHNFVVHYNLACARAVQGRLDDANADLRRSVELGFANRGHLERDPYLAPLRETEGFRMLLDHWSTVVGLQRETRLNQTREWVRGRTLTRADEDLRIDIVSAHDAPETDAALGEIARVTDWAKTFMPVDAEDLGDSAPFVVIALPGKQDFLKWAFWTYGERARRAFAGIGGSYEHDEKRLVAQDLGGTLRHEFFHVLHWRDMDRLGQIHPIWIQEGLAALTEDMDPARIRSRSAAASPVVPSGVDPRLVPGEHVEPAGDAARPPASDGGWVPAPSWRSNIVKRLAKTGPLPDFREFASMDHGTFSTNRPLATYAHARTMLLYLSELGVLGAWYERYTTDGDVGFEADPSGLAAMEAVLERELPEIEAAYRSWVREDLPMVAETGSDLDAVLGVDIEQAEMVGPRVTKVTRDARQRTGLRRLDILTAIDGRPVHDMKELIRVLSAYSPGESVTVDYRRVKLRSSSEVRLIERP